LYYCSKQFQFKLYMQRLLYYINRLDSNSTQGNVIKFEDWIKSHNTASIMLSCNTCLHLVKSRNSCLYKGSIMTLEELRQCISCVILCLILKAIFLRVTSLCNLKNELYTFWKLFPFTNKFICCVHFLHLYNWLICPALNYRIKSISLVSIMPISSW
jgi:hypothetical protein